MRTEPSPRTRPKNPRWLTLLPRGDAVSALALSALTPASRAAPRDPDRATPVVWISLVAAMIGAFMAILNIQITNASLLNIEGGIGTGVDSGSWISTSYLIGET